MARRCWSCTNSIPRRKLSTLPSPGCRVGCRRRSRNWTSFSTLWGRAWDGPKVVDFAVGRLALPYAEENPDEVVAALEDKTEAVIRELEAQHKEARRSLRRRRDREGHIRSPEKTYQDRMTDRVPDKRGNRKSEVLVRDLSGKATTQASGSRGRDFPAPATAAENASKLERSFENHGDFSDHRCFPVSCLFFAHLCPCSLWSKGSVRSDERCIR